MNQPQGWIHALEEVFGKLSPRIKKVLLCCPVAKVICGAFETDGFEQCVLETAENKLWQARILQVLWVHSSWFHKFTVSFEK